VTDQSIAPRWRARPVLAASIRVAAFVVPLGASILTGIAIGSVLPRAHSWPLTLLAWALVIATSTVALFAVDRLTRKLLPVATLLKLSMLFPDRAPSRYKIARQAAGTRALSEELRRARTSGVSGDRQQAAETILALVGALGDYDSRTRGHSERTQLFVAMIAEEMKLRPADRDRLLWAALIHDIGKLNVPGGLLNKPGSPTGTEWEQLRRHPIDGARLVAPLNDWLGPWALAVEQHHERYDGGGYPHGLAGDQISLAGRIVAVADSYEVMTAARSYKKPMSASEARAELARCSGTQFDPAVVKAFLAISLGRVRWVAGPLSWLAQVPFLQSIPLAGQAVAAGSSAVVTGATIVGLGLGPAGVAAAGTGHLGATARDHASATASATAGHSSTRSPSKGTTPKGTPGDGRTSGSKPRATATRTPSTGRTSSSSSSGGSTTSSSSSSTPPPPANHAPVAKADAYRLMKDSSPKDFAVLTNDSDPDGDPLQIVNVSTPGHGSVSFTGTKVTYQPTHGYVGSDSFSYRIVDGAGHADTATVSVQVQKDNHPPATKDDTYTVKVGQTINANVLTNDSDPDGDALTVTKDDSALINVAPDGTFSFTGVVVGKTTFHYTVSDGLATHNATVTIKVVLL
jgi:hypothetical protein